MSWDDGCVGWIAFEKDTSGPSQWQDTMIKEKKTRERETDLATPAKQDMDLDVSGFVCITTYI